MGEGYVRPPLVGAEPGSRRAAVWRFRLVALLAVILLAVLVVWAIQVLRPSDPQDPGIGGPRALARASR